MKKIVIGKMVTFNLLLLGEPGVGKTTVLKSRGRQNRRPRKERSGPRTISFVCSTDFKPLYDRLRRRIKSSWDPIIGDWGETITIWHERQEIPDDLEMIDGVIILFDTLEPSEKVFMQQRTIEQRSEGLIPCLLSRNVKSTPVLDTPKSFRNLGNYDRVVYPNPLLRPRRFGTGWWTEYSLYVLIDKARRIKRTLEEEELILTQKCHLLCQESEDGLLSTMLGIISDDTAVLFNF